MPYIPALPPKLWDWIAPNDSNHQVTVERVDDKLTVEWRRKQVFPDQRRVLFSGGIRAMYGPTTLFADSLDLDTDQGIGIAEGNVRLEDPEGTMRAQSLVFDWHERTGHATDVYITVGTLRVHVKDLDILPERWLLDQAKLSACPGNPPTFSISAKRVVVKPGRTVELVWPRLEMLGKSTGTYPTYTYSLDQRVTGLRIPTLSYRRKSGVGLNWDNSVLITDQTTVATTLAAFPNFEPSYNIQLAWSGVPASQSSALVIPRSDLGERFSESYFDNIAARDLNVQSRILRSNRRTVSVGTFWNQSTRGRPKDSNSISKQWEVAGEVGGHMGTGGGFLQARMQSIRGTRNSPFAERLVMQGSATSGQLTLMKDMALSARADGFGSVGDQTRFGWVRLSGGLNYQPIPQAMFGAAYIVGGSRGNPGFPFDPLYSKHAIHLRSDLILGPYRFGGLFKYDFDRKKWYDQEFIFSLFAGCFEPYVIFKGFPSDVRIGIHLRLDSIVGKLQNREVKRSYSKL